MTAAIGGSTLRRANGNSSPLSSVEPREKSILDRVKGMHHVQQQIPAGLTTPTSPLVRHDSHYFVHQFIVLNLLELMHSDRENRRKPSKSGESRGLPCSCRTLRQTSAAKRRSDRSSRAIIETAGWHDYNAISLSLQVVDPQPDGSAMLSATSDPLNGPSTAPARPA